MSTPNRSLIIQQYIQNIKDSKTTCSECQNSFYKRTPVRKWYKQPDTSSVCNECWKKTNSEEEKEIWSKIYAYKNNKCSVCKKQGEYASMFYNKYNVFEPYRPSIIDLINKRADWDVLQKNLDKCHVICFQCEPILDDLSLQMNYEEEKRNLRNLTGESYEEQWTLCRDDFNEKMEEIIQSLSGIYANDSDNA